MSPSEKKKVIDLLRDDSNYYGDFGKKYLSNSDIGKLLDNPSEFRGDGDETAELLQGSLLHLLLNEPEKVDSFMDGMVVQASSRNTNLYKDKVKESGKKILLLEKETEVIKALAKKFKGNMDFYDEYYMDDNKLEEPNLVELLGNMWKAKGDSVGSKLVLDAKTSSNILKFRHSVYEYNYDSAAYVYSKAFGKPMVFWVGCKKTLQIGRFTCSETMMASGERKVMEATMIYDRYFSDDAVESIDDRYIIDEI